MEIILKKCLNCKKEIPILNRWKKRYENYKYCSRNCSAKRKKNIFSIRSEVIRIKTNKGIILIDQKDKSVLDKYWNVNHYGYALCAGKKGENRLMHIRIMGKRQGLEIDHINRNRIDNRRKNLRFVTHHRNMMNAKNYVGIHIRKYKHYTPTWIAQIMIKGKIIRLGTFVKRQDALTARRNAEIEYMV